jgi:carbon-monoxide dehydrogenase large subunit
MPEGMEPGFESTTFYDPPNFAFPFGAHVAVVEVDTDTGQIKLSRYLAVDDCGTQINPMIIDGQVHGGVAQGIAGAMYEHFQYDPETARPLFASFMEYLYPTCSEVPEMTVEHFETPAPEQPLGVKGCGEGGTIGPAAVVVGAVSEALADLGVEIKATPVTPSAIRQAIREASGPGGGS